MFANLTSGIDLHGRALVLRAERQRIIASNIANADTPGYVGREVNFKEALSQLAHLSHSELSGPGLRLNVTEAAAKTPELQSQPNHLALPGIDNSELDSPSALNYALQSQPSVDNNSVDMDRERASFVDNSVHYEATLRFINGSAKTILSAIQGQ